MGSHRLLSGPPPRSGGGGPAKLVVGASLDSMPAQRPHPPRYAWSPLPSATRRGGRIDCTLSGAHPSPPGGQATCTTRPKSTYSYAPQNALTSPPESPASAGLRARFRPNLRTGVATSFMMHLIPPHRAESRRTGRGVEAGWCEGRFTSVRACLRPWVSHPAPRVRWPAVVVIDRREGW